MTLGLSLPERPGDELALATSFVLPAMLAAELAEAESAIARRPRQDGSRLDPVTEALLLACTRRQLVQVGLSPLAPERDAAAHRAANACAGYLHLLVALDGGRDSAVQVALWRTRGRAQARITLRPSCARRPVPR